jgi:Family of unknown function (DUF5681)
MSVPKDDDAVGYKRPPKAYRWKKGQSGHPGRKRGRALKSAADIIDQLFAKPVSFVENGSTRRASGLAVIVHQLVKRQFAGDRRAMDVRLKYETFAGRENAPRDILLVSDSRPPQTRNAKRAKKSEGDRK